MLVVVSVQAVPVILPQYLYFLGAIVQQAPTPLCPGLRGAQHAAHVPLTTRRTKGSVIRGTISPN